MNPELSRSAEAIRTSKRELVMQILTVFVFPILFIRFGFVPIEWRIPLLVGLVTLLVIILFTEQWNRKMLGMSTVSFWKYWKQYALFTIVGAALILVFGESISGIEEHARWWEHRHFLYLFFIVSAFQEIAYRGYLIPALAKLFKNTTTLVIANVLLFVLLHSIFPNPAINLPI